MIVTVVVVWLVLAALLALGLGPALKEDTELCDGCGGPLPNCAHQQWLDAQ